MYIVFETPRLILRRFTEADAGLLIQLNSDPEVLKYLPEPVLENEEQALEVIRNIILPQYERNLGRWAVLLKPTNQFTGWCGLKYLADSGEIDLGYRFMKQCWGQGLATEAARHTLDYGFTVLNIPLVTGRAHTGNTSSINVLQKIGMTFIKDEMIEGLPHKTFTMSKPG
jgi:RimJ/RimL family protein N-acetyltransferase